MEHRLVSKTPIMSLVLLSLLFVQVPESVAAILQYHHIGEDTPAITSTTLEDFEAHMAYLEESDLVVVPLSEIVENPEIPNDRRVAITFDDAYANIFELAVPRLIKRGFPFTIFVATEYVDRPGFFSWDELRYIEAHGGTVANHSHSHLHMLRKQEDESHRAWIKRIRLDIEKAQRLLEANLRQPAKYLAYPYGEYDLHILALIKEMGFVGFGQQSGAAGATSLKTIMPRFPLSGPYAELETFKTKVNTLALPIEVPVISPIFDTNPPTLSLKFPNPEGLRLSDLACYGPSGKTHLTSISDRELQAQNPNPLPVGRSRYNCTMPGPDGRFYWFSQLWIQKRPDGSWYPEP